MHSPRLAYVCLLAAGPLIAQSLPMYLEVSRAQVKSDRVAQFEEGGRRIVDLNRRLKGDRWIALSTEYGESGSYLFSSSRQNMAAIETGMEAFMRAMKEGMGPMANKFLQDVTGNANSFKSEIRRRRWDLSVHAPADMAAMNDLVAHTRWIRTIRIDVKPGRQMEYIEAWKGFQSELAQDVSSAVIVSENNTGSPAMFAAMYYKAMADMDVEAAGMQKAVASQSYRNFMKVTGDAVAMTNWEIHRVRPDLSNPPDEILNADPSFWKPQTEMTTAGTKKKSSSADREKK